MAKAYVFVGDASGALFHGYAVNAAGEAESDFQNAGYMVSRNDAATRADVTNALNDPCARAIWIVGHGKYNSVTGIAGKEKLTDPVESIDMVDQTIEGPSQGANIPPNACLNQVTFHACGQDLQSWKDHFTGSDFRSWSGTARGWQVYWWQFFHQYPTIDATGAETQTSQLPSPPAVEPHQEHTGQFVFEANVGKFRCDGEPQSNCWVLPSALAAAFGTQRFNLIAIDDSPGTRTAIVLGAGASGGHVGSWKLTELNPSFNVRMTNQAVRNVLVNASAFSSEVAAGHIQLIRLGATPPDQVLLDGFAGLVFGRNAMLCVDAGVPSLSDTGVLLLVLMFIVGAALFLRRQST